MGIVEESDMKGWIHVVLWGVLGLGAREGAASVHQVHRQWACCQTLSYHKKEFSKKIVAYVHQENMRILRARAFVRCLQKKRTGGGVLLPTEAHYLKRLLCHYKAGSITTLLERMDIVPISLALAQAIEESGWGTSSGARTKNACFGLSRRRCGQMQCLAFPTMKQSVIAYIDNFNRNPAYKALRKQRFKLRSCQQPIQGKVLIHTLFPYCPKPTYPSRIQYIITRLKLWQFDRGIFAQKL